MPNSLAVPLGWVTACIIAGMLAYILYSFLRPDRRVCIFSGDARLGAADYAGKHRYGDSFGTEPFSGNSSLNLIKEDG